jgi:hypothetical protein
LIHRIPFFMDIFQVSFSMLLLKMAAPGANTILGDQNSVLPAEFRNMITNKATSLCKSSRYFFYQRTKKVKLTAQPPVYSSLLYIGCPWFGVQPALFRAITTIRTLGNSANRSGEIDFKENASPQRFRCNQAIPQTSVVSTRGRDYRQKA